MASPCLEPIRCRPRKTSTPRVADLWYRGAMTNAEAVNPLSELIIDLRRDTLAIGRLDSSPQ
jgi:hypothetical protein